jgi:hypothetical protein
MSGLGSQYGLEYGSDPLGGSATEVVVVESATAADAVTVEKSSYWKFVATESAVADDEVGLANEYHKVATEGVVASDSSHRAVVSNRQISESATAADTVVEKTVTHRKIVVTEDATASDAIRLVTGKTHVVTESATASDTATRSVSSHRIVSESAIAEDETQLALSYHFVVTESAVASDAQALMVTRVRVASLAAIAADSAYRSVASVRNVSEAAVAVDVVYRREVTNYRIVATLAGVASDATLRNMVFARTALAEGVASDSITKQFYKHIIISEEAYASDEWLPREIQTNYRVPYAARFPATLIHAALTAQGRALVARSARDGTAYAVVRAQVGTGTHNAHLLLRSSEDVTATDLESDLVLAMSEPQDGALVMRVDLPLGSSEVLFYARILSSPLADEILRELPFAAASFPNLTTEGVARIVVPLR